MGKQDICYKCKTDVTYTDYGLTDKNKIICFDCISQLHIDKWYEANNE